MTYLEEFKTQISNRNFSKFLQLWEEYCTSDPVDIEEFSQLLIAIRNSDFAPQVGKMIETTLPMWKTIQNKQDSYFILKLLIDLQTTNTPVLAELAFQAVQEKYGNQPEFNERLRLVGLRNREKFQGALSNYDLLDHMKKGKFLYHPGGWGTGEIVDISPVRQQVTIEFENVSGRKHVTYENVFNALTPLEDNHFSARRFADPDKLEKEAKQDPVGVIKMLLKDLGEKTASEIKDELCELVIPEKEWVKWWQNTRAKLKKDPVIESPENLKDTFRLRKKAITNQERLEKAMSHKTDTDEIILSSYNFIRDLPNGQDNNQIRLSVKEKLLEQVKDPQLTPKQEFQIAMLLETYFSHEIAGKSPKEMVKSLANIEEIIESIEIIALKKRALILVKEQRKDWGTIYLHLLHSISHNLIRDYLFKELNQGETRELLEKDLKALLQHPDKHPDYFVWYFQQLLAKTGDHLFYNDKDGLCVFFETFLILLNKIENKPECRELTKKMYLIISAKRYASVRQIMEDVGIEHIKEFLLLAAKCHTLSDQDRKILRSLAGVIHPSLSEDKNARNKAAENEIFWTTEESYIRVQEQIKNLGSTQVVANAKEIEAARALGDLRENSEFKFAKERRARLMGELKTLSEQLQKARVLTKLDISSQEVGIGNVVEVVDSKGNVSTFTILGPWEADADRNILSTQSKLAQGMMGCRKGESFLFKDEEYKVMDLQSFLK